jgi:biotin transport system permease protein
MARRIAFHYVPGHSLLHRWDSRCKVLGLLMVSFTLLRPNVTGLLLNSSFLLSLLLLSGVPLKQFIRDLRTWGIFLFILFIFQAVLTPGPKLSLLPWLGISKDGVLLGALTCWRLALLLSYAVLFTAVTRPREVRDSVIWFLKPVPFLPEGRIGLMVSLALRFFVLILDQAEETLLAYKARLGNLKKNPFRKARFLALPLLRRSFYRVDEVTFALAARGLREDLPVRLPRVKLSHWVPLIGLFAGVGALMLL